MVWVFENNFCVLGLLVVVVLVVMDVFCLYFVFVFFCFDGLLVDILMVKFFWLID